MPQAGGKLRAFLPRTAQRFGALLAARVHILWLRPRAAGAAWGPALLPSAEEIMTFPSPMHGDFERRCLPLCHDLYEATVTDRAGVMIYTGDIAAKHRLFTVGRGNDCFTPYFL